jgi:hypothetical protein
LLQQAILNQGSSSDAKLQPKENSVFSEWWSLSGFDEGVTPLSNNNSSRQQLQQQPSSFTTIEGICGTKNEEDDEGIFDLDF